MEKIIKKNFTEKKKIGLLAFLFSFVYMVSYITRINYGAIVSEMEDATGMTRSLISIALTGNSIAYGMGQLISGFMGDRFSPKKLITLGFIITVSMNLLITICGAWYEFLIVWCINGFAQSFIWPPLVKLMADFLSEEDYKKTVTKVSWGSSIGTMLVYLLSPAIILISGWKMVFVFSAVCGIVMIFVWNKLCPSYENKKTEKEIKGNEQKDLSILFTPVIFIILFAIVLQGMLKDGVATWMPSYIAETYNLTNVIAILTGVAIPIFNIIAVTLATRLHIKVFKNPLTCAGVFYLGSTISSFIMYVISGNIATFSVILGATITGCMHGINLMLVCMIPAYFKKRDNVSTVSGIINCASYIGTAISTYGVALLSEKMGWSFTLLSWILTSLAGGILCFSISKAWVRFSKNI